MPPKKEAKPADVNAITGFDGKETKLLAAAFLSQLGPDKYDWDIMATLTGHTLLSVQRMFPPIKRKAAEAHPSFATYLGGSGANGAEKKAKAVPKKRKAAPEPQDPVSAADADESDDKADGEKKAPAKGRGRPKKAKTVEIKKEPTPDQDEDGAEVEAEEV